MLCNLMYCIHLPAYSTSTGVYNKCNERKEISSSLFECQQNFLQKELKQYKLTELSNCIVYNVRLKEIELQCKLEPLRLNGHILKENTNI